MAMREKSVKRYVVRLGGEERDQLEGLIRKGRSPAQRLLKARILLKADVSQAGDGWSDSRIMAALETSASMATMAVSRPGRSLFSTTLAGCRPTTSGRA